MRGLGSPWTVRQLETWIKQFHPDLVFISETKCLSRRIDNFRGRFGMLGVSVNAKGKLGGLCLLWQQQINLQLQSFSPFHIDVMVINTEGDDFRFTGFYGHPETIKCKEAWELLHKLSGMPLCNLADISYKGERFTWCNHREEPYIVRVRLDRATASAIWAGLFPEANAWTIPSSHSDHSAILVDTAHDQPNERTKKDSILRLYGYDRTSARRWCRHTGILRSEDRLSRFCSRKFSTVGWVCYSNRFGNVRRVVI
ncbi:UNVERIFIED_CONTAM: hypothetical protein Slati_2743300, partial [Sesamum latifolium]